MIFLYVLIYCWIGCLCVQWQNRNGEWDGNPALFIGWPVAIVFVVAFAVICILFEPALFIGNKLIKKNHKK